MLEIFDRMSNAQLAVIGFGIGAVFSPVFFVLGAKLSRALRTGRL